MLGAALAAAAASAVRELLMPLVAAVKAVPVASFDSGAAVGFQPQFERGHQPVDRLSGDLCQRAGRAGQHRPPFDRNGARIPRAFSPSAEHGDLSQVAPFLRSPEPGHRPVLEKRRGGRGTAPSGSIGEKLYKAKIYLETPDLFCWTVAVVVPEHRM